MHDQADQLRKLVRATIQVDPSLAPGGPVIALSGGQPEAGVTTAACGLARHLTRLGKQVILIDANLNNPAATRTLHARNRPDRARSGPSGTLHDVLSGNRRANEVLASTGDEHLRLLPGCPPDAPPPLDRQALERFAAELGALARASDVILLDCGHGMNAWIDALWQIAGEVLLVTTPTPQCVLDSYAAVKLSQHHRLAGKLRLLINRTIDESEVPPLAARFDATCQRFLTMTPKPAVSLPATSAKSKRPPSDEPFQRALRLLAADLACDLRVSAIRLLQPSHQRQQLMQPATDKPKDLTQRR
jgi:MinD-like ATPase involved in chromosome partitioning or flagellar assembly